LNWPKDQDPARLSNFETVARTLRYQRLATGCLERGIRSLFLGHHASDLVETIIHRLVRGQKFASAGLGGIKPVNGIPCCQSIFGASCGFEASSVSSLIGNSLGAASSTQESESSAMSRPAPDDDSFPDGVPVSESGIKIYRPLLPFPKSRLLATCTANDIPFVNDPSNFDPTTTARNAIRWLISNDKLPMVLRQDSILRLGAASTRLGEVRAKKVQELMNATQLVRFDTRSSRLQLIVPKDIVSNHAASELDAAYYVSRLLSLVSPTVEAPRSFLDYLDIARWMFPDLNVTGFSRSDEVSNSGSCTVGDAHMENVRGFSVSGRFWQLTRRPFRAGEAPESAFSRAALYSKGDDRKWSAWQAWDGRYWFRIRTPYHGDMSIFKIRAIRPLDLAQLRERERRLGPRLLQKLRNLLRDAAPGKVRYTLPVLVGGDKLYALPTLDIGFPFLQGAGGIQDEGDQLRWQVRYKDVTETLQHLKKADKSVQDAAKLFLLGGPQNRLSSTPYLQTW
jgi:tRNA(Ile)-lysidine synthase